MLFVTILLLNPTCDYHKCLFATWKYSKVVVMDKSHWRFIQCYNFLVGLQKNIISAALYCWIDLLLYCRRKMSFSSVNSQNTSLLTQNVFLFYDVISSLLYSDVPVALFLLNRISVLSHLFSSSTPVKLDPRLLSFSSPSFVSPLPCLHSHIAYIRNTHLPRHAHTPTLSSSNLNGFVCRSLSILRWCCFIIVCLRLACLH